MQVAWFSYQLSQLYISIIITSGLWKEDIRCILDDQLVYSWCTNIVRVIISYCRKVYKGYTYSLLFGFLRHKTKHLNTWIKEFEKNWNFVLRWILYKNVCFKVKEIFVCETAHLTGAQNFMSHNRVYGAQ